MWDSSHTRTYGLNIIIGSDMTIHNSGGTESRYYSWKILNIRRVCASPWHKEIKDLHHLSLNKDLFSWQSPLQS